MNTRNFPNFIEAFTEYTQHVEAPKKFLDWSAVSALAGALERKVWINFNGTHPVYPNMYIMLIGAPGLAKKSSSSELAVDLIKANPDLRFMSTQMTSASLVAQLVECGKQRFVTLDNEKYNNSSLYLYSSEAAVTLKEITGSVTELLTDFYDCKPSWWSNTVAWTKETRSDGRVEIFNPCTNMLACSTPDWLVKAIGADDIKGGFASRIIFVVQRGKPEKSVGWVDSLPDMRKLRSMLISDLGRVSQLQGQFHADKSFGTAFNVFKKRHEGWLEKNSNDKMIGYHARKAWHIMKLSQVLAVNTGDELVVNQGHWEQAEAMLTATEADMYHAFGGTGQNYMSHQIQMVWEFVRNKESFTRKEVLGAFWQDLDSKTLNETLGTLASMERIKIKASPKGLTYEVLDSSPI